MSEAVKTPRMLNIKFKPRTPARVLREIHSRYSQFIDDSDVFVDYGKSEQHKRISSSMTPGEKVRELRIVTGMTLQAVAEKIGVTYQRVNEYEGGRCGISKAIAKKLGDLFGVSPAIFI
jgi:DNA-binding XRE family transcriptional regulator